MKTHQLDSIGNESYNSLPFDYDANSLNHQYDVKYRNDGSNIKMVIYLAIYHINILFSNISQRHYIDKRF